VSNTENEIQARTTALYIANAGYTEALKTPNPAATLDDIADALPDAMPELVRILGTTPALASILQSAITDRLSAYAVVEQARASTTNDCGWAFDLLIDGLHHGGNPTTVRADAQRLAALGRNGDPQ